MLLLCAPNLLNPPGTTVIWRAWRCFVPSSRWLHIPERVNIIRQEWWRGASLLSDDVDLAPGLLFWNLTRSTMSFFCLTLNLTWSAPCRLMWLPLKVDLPVFLCVAEQRDAAEAQQVETQASSRTTWSPMSSSNRDGPSGVSLPHMSWWSYVV